MSFQTRYDNWTGGEWVAPVKGQYFENPTPVTGQPFCEVARGTAENIRHTRDRRAISCVAHELVRENKSVSAGKSGPMRRRIRCLRGRA